MYHLKKLRISVTIYALSVSCNFWNPW